MRMRDGVGFMIGRVLAGIRTRPWTASSLSAPVFCSLVCGGLLACVNPPSAAFAADCPGHPDAIGTSRTIVVDPREHPRIGSMQYPETLPLRDHEVVLTFDDGPLPRNSNQVLQILADNCAKATFFLIGEQARAFPDGVRKLGPPRPDHRHAQPDASADIPENADGQGPEAS